ncbi:Unknown protein [Striga hermonthica]|uniref:Uncharacterized protein n=1 Tax=Striga hermonthica TaxID=68872 RepID=A0A9N7N232_STRHE|nr:Unknown protein [Striga hermonthica]
MSTSIFSSFEALFALTLFGRKISCFRGPAPCGEADDNQGSEVKIGGMEKGKEVNASPSKPEDRRRVMTARFAPELDGVYCFETIVHC